MGNSNTRGDQKPMHLLPGPSQILEFPTVIIYLIIIVFFSITVLKYSAYKLIHM